MTKLKLAPPADERPVRLSLQVPAAVHRDLVTYANALGSTDGPYSADPTKLIVPMIERFMATDREFAKLKRKASNQSEGDVDKSG